VIILNTREIGSKYEDKSVEILIKNSYKVLERNYQNKYGEIDIIAQKDDEIVFVEVKYRKTNKFGYGYEAVDRKKLFKIVKLAQLYMQSKKYEKYKMRFDCMSYLEDELDWIKNIVWGDEIGF
jgi:TIGR00252 family protein